MWWNLHDCNFGYICGGKRKINTINNQKHYKSWKRTKLMKYGE
jgi:hypothetical protein